ncbi:T9SS type A sorting domain-containing protein [Neolewinella aurantiaca]|uniref:T9SS type A sorting domain-containing protein n=2 Tax=Neolewinella aurantiaca TaxID=2602767 RepID=A0A5C7FJN7_9BACT|nr:T9SS type A sorting domain-containing protein [Neolewinella aurantiaca]
MFCSCFASAQITITDASLVGGQTYNWTNDNEYILDGLVFLEEGGVLNIEAGTVIRGIQNDQISTGDNTSALIITRGAQIFARGTADAPIIFTAREDDLSDAGDFTSADRGEWGGLIVLGNATVARPGGEDNIEGIDADEARATFGGGDTPDDAESSGVLNYVSIRHAGAQLSTGNEINGLTLGGVGAGTEIDYVEVFANLDDGIEWFGGTVSVKHASVAFCGDDGFDYDFGWRGKGQFWFAIQEPGTGTGRSGEHDGANPDGQAPFSQPTIYNATYIGIGNGATATGGDANRALPLSVLLRDNAGGFYNNSIFTGFNGAAIAIEDRDDTDVDAYARFQAGDLAFSGNIFEDFGAGSTAADLFLAVDQGEVVVPASTATVAAAFAADNTIGASGIASIGRTANGGLDPRIDAGGAALSGGVPSDDEFFNLVSYRGAFGNRVNWLEDWTALDAYGYLGDNVEPVNTNDCIVVTDADLVGGQTYNWGGGNCYTLDGLVFLEADGVLNIEAGTVVRGLNADGISTGDNTSALIIARDAQIFARGTAAEPIIFTAAEDDLNDNGDFTSADRGEWGGLIILGNGTVARPGGEDNIEGIDADEARATFGGGDTPDDAESSGVLNYVSIRHGGSQLSTGNEINGLTLGGVGAGTEIDFIEVFANLDDGIEWFGGTVSVKHASVAFCGDDGFDYDFGWRGKGQFWFAIQEPGTGTGRSGEHDGANPDGQAPFSQPTIYNATYVGIGNGATASGGDANRAIPLSVLLRDNAGGFYNNSIFTGFNGAAIAVEDRDDTDVDAYARFQAGDLAFSGNIFEDFGAGTTPSDLFLAVDQGEVVVPASTSALSAAFAADNTIGATGIAGISRTPNGGLDPRINAGGVALGGGVPSDDEFFSIVTYRGAFGNTANWLADWTALAEYGYLGDVVTPINNNDCITITDADLVGGQTYNWGGGNCYTLDGLVFLEEDGVLNIEQGTVIRGLGADDVSTGDNTSALIISRGAQINATGTAEAPIIFTAAGDDLDDDNDFTNADRGEWGGLIILGNATVARPGGEDNIEGIDADESRATFGGGANPDDTESSGTLTYVSIRHGGSQLSTGNEINGLTLGGVGSGTTIDYVEVFANLDDGIEWFGGTVRVDHAAVSFCGDDGFDYDFGWRGGGQFWYALQGPGAGTGRSGEHDGANPDGQAPFSQPTIYNATYVGIGNGQTATGGDANRALPLSVLFRDNAGGFYRNSIFTDFNGAAIAIEDRDDTEVDAYARFVAGDLALSDNIFFNFGAGTDAADLFLAVDQGEAVNTVSSAVVAAGMVAANNRLIDPVLLDMDRESDGGDIDPRPNEFSPAAFGAPAAVDGFESVKYYGAFEPGENLGNGAPNWLTGWSALTTTNVVVMGTTGVGEVESAGFLLDAPVPNPASDVTRVNFTLPRTADVTLTVIDMLGRPLARRARTYNAGAQFENIDVTNMPNGTYFIVLDAEGGRLLQKLVVNK